MRVEFDEAAALAGMAQHAQEVDVVGFALADQPARRMRQDAEVPLVDGAQQPLGLPRARQVEAVVHGTDDEVQPPQDGVGASIFLAPRR